MARIGCPPGDNADADLYHEMQSALSEFEAQPSQTEDLEGGGVRIWKRIDVGEPTEDLEAMAKEFLHSEGCDGGDYDAETLRRMAAFARSPAQPSAPTVEKIMEVVEPIAYEAMLKARSWQFMPIIQHADIDDALREPLHAALTKLLNP